MARINHCGTGQFTIQFPESWPLRYPGLGIPAYLLRPALPRLPGVIARVRRTGPDRVVVTVQPPAPPAPVLAPVQPAPARDHTPIRLCWATDLLAEVADAAGHHHVLPLSALSGRLRAQAAQLYRSRPTGARRGQAPDYRP